MEKVIQFFTGDKTPVHTDKLRTQLAIIARILVGGYVVYLGYGLKDAVKNAMATGEGVWFIVAFIVFIVAGGLLCYSGLRDYAIGRYVGGKLDLGSENEEVVDVSASSKDN